jgi:hypothetical protein
MERRDPAAAARPSRWPIRHLSATKIRNSATETRNLGKLLVDRPKTGSALYERADRGLILRSGDQIALRCPGNAVVRPH